MRREFYFKARKVKPWSWASRRRVWVCDFELNNNKRRICLCSEDLREYFGVNLSDKMIRIGVSDKKSKGYDTVLERDTTDRFKIWWVRGLSSVIVESTYVHDLFPNATRLYVKVEKV